jgi:hypothetical protein
MGTTPTSLDQESRLINSLASQKKEVPSKAMRRLFESAAIVESMGNAVESLNL